MRTNQPIGLASFFAAKAAKKDPELLVSKSQEAKD